MSSPLQAGMCRSFSAALKHSLLTAEEERALARRGDRLARERLALSNLRFVAKIAQQYRCWGLPMADLIQEGNVGLLIALQRFDPRRGLRLTTYAVWWIRAQIKSHILANWSLVRIGTTQAQRKLFFSLRRVRRLLEQRSGGRPASAERVAAALSVPPREVQQMETRLLREVSLEAPLGSGTERTVGDAMPSPCADPESLVAEREEHAWRMRQVEAALRRLGPRERLIIERRWLTDSPVTFGELSARFGVSRERARQLERGGLTSLKRALAA